MVGVHRFSCVFMRASDRCYVVSNSDTAEAVNSNPDIVFDPLGVCLASPTTPCLRISAPRQHTEDTASFRSTDASADVASRHVAAPTDRTQRDG